MLVTALSVPSNFEKRRANQAPSPQAPSPREAPSSKSQTPTPINREQAKSQASNPRPRRSGALLVLEFEIWDFFGIWNLGFGISLELGSWSLALIYSACPIKNAAHPRAHFIPRSGFSMKA